MKLTTSNQGDFKVVGISDGTLTQVEVVAYRPATDFDGERWDQVGLGTAKRRKGDTRNEMLGMSLALQRAFEDAADYFKRAVAEIAEEVILRLTSDASRRSPAASLERPLEAQSRTPWPRYAASAGRSPGGARGVP